MFTLDAKFLLAAVLLSAAFSIEASSSVDLDARQVSLPPGWNSLGCYTDSMSSRTLNMVAYIATGNMTIEYCLAFCASKGYNNLYAGVENGRECYCDIILQIPGSPANATDCNMQCSGNTAQICGGPGRINIFWHTPPVQVDPPVAWSSLGCYTDSISSRTLRAAAYTSAENMTTDLCFEFCTPAGYKYAGVEWGGECFCDNTIYAPGTPVRSDDCITPCRGNTSQICGAGNRINIFSRPTSNPTPAINSHSNHIKHVVLPVVLTVLGVILIAICIGAWLRRKRLQMERELYVNGPPMENRSVHESFGDGRA